MNTEVQNVFEKGIHFLIPCIIKQTSLEKLIEGCYSLVF